MDEILREVQTYDANTLRKKLLEYGVKVGPIAPTTISLFQKRLANELCRLRGIETDDLKDKSKAVTVELDNKVYVPSGATRTDEPNEKISDVYYAVCLPGNVEPNVDSAAEQLVFSDKELALKTAKKYKGSRFKVFKSEQDAKVFSRLTAESALPSPRRPSQEDNIVQDTAPSGESSPFKAPKPQELALLRKTVESGDVEAFKRQVWNNPRFLVGSGDTPAMFQEGPRYTAMHVAAMKNKPEICQAILDILEDPVFVNKLYAESKHTEETQNSRINFLVDLYLNMPDKGNCESPLHMACKYGHAEVVQVLVAHPRTDKTLRNKYGDTPKTLICSRCTAPSSSVKKQIEDLLQGQCYVPLMRYEDNAAPPVVVQPWSPDVSNTPLDVPVVSNSPRDISMSVKACAGPMSPTDAGLFHKRWTTPPSQSPELARAFFNTKRSDSEKGMERIGRQLAHELNVPWSEYWEFLDQFVDMKTPAGLDLLENYLKKRVWLKFIKDFKESQGISEQIVDYSAFTTPKMNRLRQLKVNELDQSTEQLIKLSFESDIVKDDTPSKTTCSPDSVKDYQVDREIDANDEVTPATCCGLISKQCGEGTSEDKDNEGEVFKGGFNDVLSPVSNLAQHFATMKLNDSWSERATVNSTDKSMSDKNTDRNDNGKSTSPPAVERFLSAESESSYTTAPEDLQDLSLSFSTPSSPEVQTGRVCFKLKDVAIFQTLLDVVRAHKQLNNFTGSSDIVKFVVQLKKNGDFLNIISIPEVDNVQKMVLLEDVEVETCDGDINKVLEGDVIEIGADSLEVEDDTVVLAYLIRTQKLPRAQYIYGPQPTREDLNVSRALEDVTLSPECHPNVFHWKINLSKFLRDTNYRWQSPAKIKARIKQASPVPSPLGKSSPVIPYGSPLATRNQPTNHVTSDIRTRLFPSIQE